MMIWSTKLALKKSTRTTELDYASLGAGRRSSENFAPSLRPPTALSIGRQRVLEIKLGRTPYERRSLRFLSELYFQ